MLDIKIMTPEAVADWAEAHDPDAPVGERASALGCPLACYLHTHGYPRATVGYAQYWLEVDVHGNVHDAHDTPKWAMRLIEAVDDGGPVHGDVLPAEVLALLRP